MHVTCVCAQVELEFLPWLTQQALVHVEQEAVARTVLQHLVAEAVVQQVMRRAIHYASGNTGLSDRAANPCVACACVSCTWCSLARPAHNHRQCSIMTKKSIAVPRGDQDQQRNIMAACQRDVTAN